VSSDRADAIERLRTEAAGCTRCDLYRHATQTVFGDGPPDADLVLVGEQPGDKEDLSGEPFVGPAGRVLDQALERAGIDRRRAYVTNAVKHFKWAPRAAGGKVRLHKKPNAAEQAACRPWLDAELAALHPEVVVCLGAVAANALLGRQFRVSVDRGRFVESPLAPHVLATVHPSSILRGPPEEREASLAGLVADLSVVREVLPRRARLAS
jgi:uracil-DNA glycosylase